MNRLTLKNAGHHQHQLKKAVMSSIHSDFQPMASSQILQIFLRLAIQNQIRIAQLVIIDEIIQFWPLRHGHVQRILDPGAVDGNFSSIPEQQLHAAGIHVEMAGSCIVLHVCVLSALRHSYSGLSCFFVIRGLGRFSMEARDSFCFPKNTKNPNPSPIGKKFGFCWCGAPPGTRTLGPLIKSQLLYQLS